jgi:hypothetical protein
MPTIDATPGSPTANSYITLADALLAYDAMLNTETFLAADTAVQERALITATKRIERITEWEYDMIGASRVSTTQALTFPRIGTYTKEQDAWYGETIIPPFVIEAQLVQALAEIESDRDADPPGRGIQRMRADVLEIEYDDSASQEQRPIRDTVYTILEPWLVYSDTTADKYYLRNSEVRRV